MTANRPNRWVTLKRRLFPRGLSFTREGKVYVGVTLGVGFAAVNTNNNLLFLVLGLMLGLIIVSGILSEIALRGLTISRQLPRRVEAEASFAVELKLHNGKAHTTSFSVELRDEIDGQPFRRRCFFLRLAPGESQAIAYHCERHERGRSHFSGTMASTRYPFGLFEKRRFFALTDDIIVLPARLPLRLAHQLAAGGENGLLTDQRGPGQEFLELRDISPGDDPRNIHWRSSARLSRLLVRENHAEPRGLVEIVLDPALREDSTPARLELEHNIRIAGTIVRDVLDSGGVVRLITGPERIIEAREKREAIAQLEHLALLEVTTDGRSPPPRGRARGALLLGQRAGTIGRGRRLDEMAVAPRRQRAP